MVQSILAVLYRNSYLHQQGKGGVGHVHVNMQHLALFHLRLESQEFNLIGT